MNKSTNSDSIYRAVVEVLTNNYTANLFSSLQRENLAKKVSHKISSILSIDKESQDVATHMGAQIIKNENNTKDGLTKEKADKIELSKSKKVKKSSNKKVKVQKSNEKASNVLKKTNMEKKSGLKNLKQ